MASKFHSAQTHPTIHKTVVQHTIAAAAAATAITIVQ